MRSLLLIMLMVLSTTVLADWEYIEKTNTDIDLMTDEITTSTVKYAAVSIMRNYKTYMLVIRCLNDHPYEMILVEDNSFYKTMITRVDKKLRVVVNNSTPVTSDYLEELKNGSVILVSIYNDPILRFSLKDSYQAISKLQRECE